MAILSKKKAEPKKKPVKKGHELGARTLLEELVKRDGIPSHEIVSEKRGNHLAVLISADVATIRDAVVYAKNRNSDDPRHKSWYK